MKPRGLKKNLVLMLTLMLTLVLVTGAAGCGAFSEEPRQEKPEETEERMADQDQDPEKGTGSAHNKPEEKESNPEKPGTAKSEQTKANKTVEEGQETPEPDREKASEAPEPEKDQAKDSRETAREESDSGPTVQVSIPGLVDKPPILEKTTVKWEEEDTVIDVLIRVAREENIQLAYRGHGNTRYVEGIDHLYEFDEGPGSGWVYQVNETFPDRGSGAWPVEPGEHIQWHYSLDMGRDVGAGPGGGETEGE